MTKPRIGITLDAENNGGYSAAPWYALRQNYCDMVEEAGGIPFPIPHYPHLATFYADQIDGLLITGGACDIDPELYGEEIRFECLKLKPHRTTAEIAIAQAVYSQSKPLLGICGGMQLLNVMLGGSLIQHVPEEVNNSLEHMQTTPWHEPAHTISIHPGTRLHHIAQNETIGHVNTSHHQAVNRVAESLRVNAVADDGVIEGIESQDPHHFLLGVQWHPEYRASSLDTHIFQHFIKATQS